MIFSDASKQTHTTVIIEFWGWPFRAISLAMKFQIRKENRDQKEYRFYCLRFDLKKSFGNLTLQNKEMSGGE